MPSRTTLILLHKEANKRVFLKSLFLGLQIKLETTQHSFLRYPLVAIPKNIISTTDRVSIDLLEIHVRDFHGIYGMCDR